MTSRFIRFRSILAIVALLMAGIFYSGASFAHKVNMFAFVEGDQVFIEGYFSDGKRAQNSKVTVSDEQGKTLLKGETDHEGNFSFRVPAGARSLRITLNAGMGHKTEYTLGQDELAGALPEGETAAAKDVAVTDETTAGAVGGPVDEHAIRRAVGQAILPLMRRMSSLEERASFSDIIGGIGFIVGVTGLFFYFKARNMMRDMNTSSQGGDTDLQGRA